MSIGSKRSVLIVDDSGIFGFTLSLEFRNSGWDVYCSGSGEEALAQLREKSFDLVLTDVFMPLMRGDQLATKVLEIKPETKVILMSSMPRERLPPLPKGVAFLPKPVSVPSIIEAFDRTLRPGGGPPPPLPPIRA